MPHRFLRAVEPVVAHGLREMSVEGANLEHTLLEVALMSALVGSGVAPTQAIRRVEAEEAELLRTHPGEAVEPYHAGAAGVGVGQFGKGVQPLGKGAQPWGKGAQPWAKDMQTWGAGMQPWGKGMQPWGAGKQPWGQGAMPYGETITPYGKGAGMGTFGKGMGMTPSTTTPYMGGVRY